MSVGRKLAVAPRIYDAPVVLLARARAGYGVKSTVGEASICLLRLDLWGWCICCCSENFGQAVRNVEGGNRSKRVDM